MLFKWTCAHWVYLFCCIMKKIVKIQDEDLLQDEDEDHKWSYLSLN